MRIKKEDFDKLSQLDRIEYRQTRNDIEERYHSSLGIYNYLILLTYIFIVDIWFHSGTGVWILTYPFIYLLIQVILICTLIEIIIILAFAIIRKKEFRKLEDKFFIVKIKKRRN